MRRLVACLAPVALAAMAAVVLGGCKQQAGERCQISSDCASGLSCNAHTMTCEGGSSNVDGGISGPDAQVDGGPPDAMPDAAVDASPDAAVDASPDATFR